MGGKREYQGIALVKNIRCNIIEDGNVKKIKKN